MAGSHTPPSQPLCPVCLEMICGLPVPSIFHWSQVVGREAGNVSPFCSAHICIFWEVLYWLFTAVVLLKLRDSLGPCGCPPAQGLSLGPVSHQARCLHTCQVLQTPRSGYPSPSECPPRWENMLPWWEGKANPPCICLVLKKLEQQV